MNWQDLLALLIVLAAAYSLWRRSRRKGHGSCEHCDPDIKPKL